MHPLKIKSAMSSAPMRSRKTGGVMKGKRMKAGFLGPLLGFAAPILSSVLPGLIDRIIPPRRQAEGIRKRRGGMVPANFDMRWGKTSKAGLAAPYGGKMKAKIARGAFQPGPLA